MTIGMIRQFFNDFSEFEFRLVSNFYSRFAPGLPFCFVYKQSSTEFSRILIIDDY